jgi:hypothetical protein
MTCKKRKNMNHHLLHVNQKLKIKITLIKFFQNQQKNKIINNCKWILVDTTNRPNCTTKKIWWFVNECEERIVKKELKKFDCVNECEERTKKMLVC